MTIQRARSGSASARRQPHTPPTWDDDEETAMTISARQHNPVDVTNLEQATAWDGAAGDEWTVHADRHDAACRHYDPHLIDAAQIAATDHVLDIGCGTGMSTRKAARAAIAGTAT